MRFRGNLVCNFRPRRCLARRRGLIRHTSVDIVDHCEVDHGFGAGREVSVIPGEYAVEQPADGALDHPLSLRSHPQGAYPITANED